MGDDQVVAEQPGEQDVGLLNGQGVAGALVVPVAEAHHFGADAARQRTSGTQVERAFTHRGLVAVGLPDVEVDQLAVTDLHGFTVDDSCQSRVARR